MQKILLFMLLLGIPAMAQTGAAGGSIRGTILDPSGSAIASAPVDARNLETGFERAAISNQSGEYDVPLLQPGRYEVTVSAKGFAPFKQTGIVVQLSKASTLDVRLSVASSQQSVTVEG